MTLLLLERNDIKRYIHALRGRQQRSWHDGSEESVERLLHAHEVTMEKCERDYYYGAHTPLADWLSLLDDPERLDRVSQVLINVDKLGGAAREIWGEIIGDLSASNPEPIAIPAAA